VLVRAADASGGDWIVGRWSSAFEGQLVPSRFAACARIFHPAALHGTPVRWATIAEAFGTVAHPRMEFEPLTRRGTWDYRPVPGLFDRAPAADWLPTELVAPVVDVLRRHTSLPDRCGYGVWHGHADLPDSWRSAPELVLPGRTYYLFTGTLDDAIGVEDPSGDDRYRRPALWWPDDHAWFLGSDTDLPTTYVAGSAALVRDLIASGLEVHEVSPETDFAHRGDDVNPTVDGA
jgi:hypothetical protein